MARCPDCIHFNLCDYNTNIAGDAKIKLYYDEGAEKCSFFTPIADVVVATRCKSCLYCKTVGNKTEMICLKQTAYKKPNDFCSSGLMKGEIFKQNNGK